jgi:peroxiredoxin
MPEEILPGARATKRGSSRSPDESDTDVPAASAPINGAANTSVRPKWRDFTDNQAEVPLDESIRQAVHEEKPHESNVVTLTGAVTRAKPARPRLLGSSRPPIDDAVKQTVCRFDPSERRLVDFQLPGLDGKMVSLHDVDADVILLDFWGSWCSHCGTSTRHLGELQAKTGGKRFQVVGIACEKGSSLLDRRATAEKAMQTLGINYPVLISSKDGTCPVQQALQIQFYPTMVLLDRNGRVLAREEGATELTLTRMDRAIEAALKQ